MSRTAKLSEDKKTLTLTQSDHVEVYAVEDTHPDPGVAQKAFRLKNSQYRTYDCWLDEWGQHCDCGAFLFRNVNNDPCKHLLALQVCGLLPKERR